MNKNKQARKKWIILTVVIVLIAALVLGAWFFVQYKNDQKTVEVLPVSQLSTTYWNDQSYSYGTVSTDYIQELYPDENRIITDVYVEEGQEVSVGDPLLQYDKTKLELDVESKEVAVKEADLKIDTAQNQLKKLQNTKPVATAKPTTKPTVKPKPTPTRKPTQSPTPTPVPTADVVLYSRLDLDSDPYKGTGTTDDPYVFLCTEDCVMTSEFLRWLLGLGISPSEEPTPTPTPTPSPPPSSDVSGEDSELSELPSEPETTPTPSPSPSPKPESDLATPFAAVFEVRDGNSNYGKLISAFKLDGTQLSANFQISSLLTGASSLGTVADVFGASPSPSASSNNYNDMGYTSAQLKELIAEKKQEIKDLQLELKQAKLNLEKSQLQLKNSTVLSSVDGAVRTLIDLDTATAENKPFMVVAGDQQYYISGTISENLLGSIQVGDEISAFCYENGTSYTAQITSIADYPVESDSMYYGGGNPNSSNYEFVAVIQDGSSLQNGMSVEITMNSPSADENALYLDSAYLREDDGGTYVMKAGIDNRLIKQYVQTGKSIYNGSYQEIQSGLTIEDYVAFPYGSDAKEGVRVLAEGLGDNDTAFPDIPEGSPEIQSSLDSESSLPEENGDGTSSAFSDDLLNAEPDEGVIDGEMENGGSVSME